MQPSVEVREDRDVENIPFLPTIDTGLPSPLLLDISSLDLNDRQLEKLFLDNGNLQFEVTAKGELVIMAPSGDSVSVKETELVRQVSNWAKVDGAGIAYGTSGGFRMPNGALYVPDVSWVNGERRDAWRLAQAALPERERRSFPGLCPDFVLELRSSRRDRLSQLHLKMLEYLENGARLGWLIDPINKRVHIYRPGEAVVILDEPETVSGDPVLPGFVLDLREIWST